ncbi:hypothetical protein GJAV_G00037360 [Gymnothorax javanicus]|nr:hypothetical protein GJAV_G00037360 [Gymnothorax javanicus]
MPGEPKLAHRIAAKYGYSNLGQVGGLKDHYLFSHHVMQRRAVAPSRGQRRLMTAHREVEWIQQKHPVELPTEDDQEYNGEHKSTNSQRLTSSCMLFSQ